MPGSNNAGKRPPPAASSGGSDVALAAAAAFLALVAGAALAGRLPFAVPGLYFLASVATFAAYALDKSAARSRRWRIPERVLHLFALAGGWPGALAAQGLLRHKSRKRSFQIVFWATVALNCSALAWLSSTSGAGALRFIPGAS